LKRFSPFQLVTLVVGFILLTEFGIEKLTGSTSHEALTDAWLLIMILTPFIYFLIFRPMNRYISELQVVNQRATQMNSELEQLNAELEEMNSELEQMNLELEQRVQERTAELVKLNKLLESDYTEALRLSEERHKTILNSLPLGVAIISPDLRVISVNDQLKAWYPDVAFEDNPHCYKAFRHSNGNSPCDGCPVRKTLADGKSHEKLVKRRDVDLCYQRLRTAPLIVNGKLANVVEIIEDVTEQQQLLMNIRESNEKFRELFNKTSDILLVHDLGGAITEVNEAAVEKLGYTREEFLSMKPVDLVAPEKLQPEEVSKFEQAMREQKRHIMESTLMSKSGTRIVVEIDSIVINISGKMQVLSICRDITHHKRTLSKVNKALEESENRYRSLIEQSAEGIYVWDLETRKIQEANSQFLQLLGYTQEELADLFIEDIVALERDQLDSLIESLKQGFSVCGQRLYRAKDGSLIEVEVSVSPVTLGQSKVCLVNVRDVRERNKAARAITQSIENLKRTLKETVNALVTVTEKRDPYTAGHMQRVAEIAVQIGKELNLSPKQLEALDMAARLHDIGKIYVPSDILNKPGRLTEAEMTIIRSHPEVSYEILNKIPFEVSIADIVRQHHERYNGSGYPDGLKGEEILIEARILAVADVLEAMASHRPYRPALGLDQALEEIKRNQGTLYDPQVVQAALKVMPG